MPTSFVITAGLEDAEYHAFLTRYKELSKQVFYKEHVPQKHCT